LAMDAIVGEAFGPETVADAGEGGTAVTPDCDCDDTGVAATEVRCA
jgi:hypothetical protein